MSDASKPVLVSVPVSHILTFWRPGSRDWTWLEEYTDLVGTPETAAIEERISVEGFGFHDHIAPVLLGSDHRVWDGHHRIILAIRHAVGALMVEFAGTDLRSPHTPPTTTTKEADR